jgi:hypothetical protein
MIVCKAAHAKAVDKAVFPGTQGGPLEHVIAAKAVALKEALDPSFKEYCGQVVANARALAAALVARGLHVVSGGTDNHLMLVDLRNRGLTGKVAEQALDVAGITVNKNTVPRETQSPFVTSGVRIGTPAVSTAFCKPRATSRRRRRCAPTYIGSRRRSHSIPSPRAPSPRASAPAAGIPLAWQGADPACAPGSCEERKQAASLGAGGVVPRR